jgi:hypothetical protein
MPKCQFPIFCCFCVLEKLHRKYSQNWMNQKPKFLFSRYETESKAETEGGQRAATPPMARATPWPRRDLVWALVHLLTLPFHLYIPLNEKTLRPRSIFQKTYCKPPPSLTRDRKGLEALLGTLPERGITTGVLLHHHGCLRSDV